MRKEVARDVAPLLRRAPDRVGSEADPIPLNTQEIRESYIPCQCEQSGQHLLWLWDALAAVDQLRAELDNRGGSL